MYEYDELTDYKPLDLDEDIAQCDEYETDLYCEVCRLNTPHLINVTYENGAKYHEHKICGMCGEEQETYQGY